MSLWHVSLIIFLLHGLCLEYLACLEAKSLGFTIDMIHRDAPQSPLYNSSKTPKERFISGIRGSTNRINQILSSNNDLPESRVASDNGQYLINFSLGSPPTQFYGIVDTGSDLLWTQCSPCISCYKQKNPVFNPQTSSTYKDLSCTSQQCQWLNHVCSGPSNNNNCEYNYAYGGGAYTIGYLASDTLTLTNSNLGQPFPLNNIIFGCGHNNSGPSESENGIFALGGGPLSLVSQIGSFLGSMKFSQCLVPFHTNPSISSKLTFGIDANVKGKGVISTPLVPKEDTTPYFVTLKGFSIGEKFIPFNALSGKIQEGNMFIDSGTPPILLPQDLYDRLENELINAIPLKPIQELRPQLCYHSQKEVTAPVIIANFEGGDLGLTPMNTFIPVEDGVYCFTMSNFTGDVGIFGNYGQVDFMISFDLESKIVSFKSTDCTKSQ